MWCHLTTQEEGHYQTAVNTCNAKIHPPLEAWPQLLSLKLFFFGGGEIDAQRAYDSLKLLTNSDTQLPACSFGECCFHSPWHSSANTCVHRVGQVHFSGAPCTRDLRTCALKGGLVCCFLKQHLDSRPQGSYLWSSREQTLSFQKVSRTHSTHRAGPPAALCSLEGNPQMLTHWFPLMKSRRQSQVWVSANVRKVPLGLQCIFQCSVWNRNINRTFKMLLLGYF